MNIQDILIIHKPFIDLNSKYIIPSDAIHIILVKLINDYTFSNNFLFLVIIHANPIGIKNVKIAVEETRTE